MNSIRRSVRALPGAGLLLSLLCCLPVSVAAQEGDAAPLQTVVDSVRIEGLRTASPIIVRNALRISEGASYSDESLLDRQRESLRGLMGLGLFDDADIAFVPSGSTPGHAVAVVQVKELPVAASVAIEGEKKINEKDLREGKDGVGGLQLAAGSVLSPSRMERDRQSMLDQYRAKGYLLASIEPVRGQADSLGRVPLTWKIVEGAKVRVGEIVVDGNSRLSDKEIRGKMTTKQRNLWMFRTGEFHDDTLLADLKVVEAFYREKGFLDAKVVSHEVNLIPGVPYKDRRATRARSTNLDSARFTGDPWVQIRLKVAEGPRYYRGRVSFSGQEILSEKQLRSQLLIDSGEVMNGSKLEEEQFLLMSGYREEGRLFARVEPIRTFRDSIVDILYMIQEGKPATIHHVLITGNDKTRDKVIRRELRIFPGDLFRQSALQRSQREIMQLNFFDQAVPDIQLTDRTDTTGEVDLLFKVTERERGTGTFSAGATYSPRDGLYGNLGLQIPNFMGRGQQIDVSTEYGANRQSLRLGFSEPWLFDTPTRVGGGLFYTHYDDINTSNSEYTSYGFDASLGRRLTWPDDYFSVSSSYNFSHNSYGSSADRFGAIQTDGVESSLGFGIVRDDKDLPVFPTTGSRYQLSYRKVGGPLGGSFDYSQISTKVNWWFPTFWKFTLGIEAQAGILQGDVIQASDLYTMGSMFGYSGKLRGYSPGAIGRARIGRSFLSTTAELRFPVVNDVFYLLGFADAGNVFGRTLRDQNRTTDNPEGSLGSPWTEIDPSDLKRDYGFGFRLQIPMMGILGFDFAWGLDPDESLDDGANIPNDGMKLNFVMENAF